MRSLLSPFVLRFVLLAPALAGCSGAAPDPTASLTSPIIGGTPSDASQDSVVQLIATDPNSTAKCTATLIAPNLVITARHCVSVGEVSGGMWYNCNMDGTPMDNGVFGADEPASALTVIPGAAVNGTAAATATRVYHDSTMQACNHDLALVLLDKAVPGPIASIRLDSPPVQGEDLTIVGFGKDAMGNFPSVREQRAVKALDVGPSAKTPLPPNEFLTSEATCNGDSGGPAFDSATKALIGVTSRNFNTTTCAGASDIFTMASRFKDLILKAFADAGHSPVLEGGGSTSSSGSSGSGGSSSTSGSSGSSGSSSTSGSSGGNPNWGGGNQSGGCGVVDGKSSSPWTLAPLGIAGLAIAISRRKRNARR